MPITVKSSSIPRKTTLPTQSKPTQNLLPNTAPEANSAIALRDAHSPVALQQVTAPTNYDDGDNNGTENFINSASVYEDSLNAQEQQKALQATQAYQYATSLRNNAVASALEGLGKAAGELDGQMSGRVFRQYGQEREEKIGLAMVKDLQDYQNKIAQFQDRYKAGFQGADAGHALEKALVFNRRELDRLRDKYSALPLAAGYIDKHGSALALANVRAMQDYGNEQHLAYKSAVHEKELESARARLSDWRTTPEEREAIRADLTKKVQAFYGNYDNDPSEQLAKLDGYFKDCLTRSGQNRLEHLRKNDPQEALRLLRNALAQHSGGGLTLAAPDSPEPYGSPILAGGQDSASLPFASQAPGASLDFDASLDSENPAQNTQLDPLAGELASLLTPRQLKTEWQKSLLAVREQAEQKTRQQENDTYAELRSSLEQLPLEHQAELAFQSINEIADPELREAVKLRFANDHFAAQISQAATDAKLRRDFIERARTENLRPSQALEELAQLPGLSNKSRQRIAAELMGHGPEQTRQNTALLDQLRSHIDSNKVLSAEALEAFAFDAGLTDEQTSKARQYYAASGSSRAAVTPGENTGGPEQNKTPHLKMSLVDTVLKSLGHAQTLADLPGFFDLVADNLGLEPGKSATIQTVRKTVSELLESGFAKLLSGDAEERETYETAGTAETADAAGRTPWPETMTQPGVAEKALDSRLRGNDVAEGFAGVAFNGGDSADAAGMAFDGKDPGRAEMTEVAQTPDSRLLWNDVESDVEEAFAEMAEDDIAGTDQLSISNDLENPNNLNDWEKAIAGLGLPEGSTLLAAMKKTKSMDKQKPAKNSNSKKNPTDTKSAPATTPKSSEQLLNPLTKIDPKEQDEKKRKQKQQYADTQQQELVELSKAKDAGPAIKQAAAVSKVLEPLLKETRAKQAHEYDTETLHAQYKKCIDESELSDVDKKFAMSHLVRENGLFLNLRCEEKIVRKKRYEADKQAFLQTSAQKYTDINSAKASVDEFMEKCYKKAYGDPSPSPESRSKEWRLKVPDSKYYPERAKLMAETIGKVADKMLADPKSAEQLRAALLQLDPEVDFEAWGKARVFVLKNGEEKSRAGLPKQLIERVKKHADKHGVPLLLALGVVSQESNGKEDAVSRAAAKTPKTGPKSQGALGLMQVQENLLRDLKNYYPHIKEYARSNVEQNIELGVLALKMELEHFDGDWRRALGAYHQGISAVAWLNDDLSIPAGTNPTSEAVTAAEKAQDYVEQIGQYFRERQPNTNVPSASPLSYLPQAKKKEYLRKAQTLLQNNK